MLGRCEAGSSSTVGIAISTATIATAFLAAHMMVEAPPVRDARDLTYAHAATTALALVVAEPGLAPGATAWERDADRIQRFGLAKEDAPNFLDYAKIRALRNGTMAKAANGHPDYPDVKDALGLAEADFHLRSYPVLPGLDDPRWTREPHGRLAYLARFGGAVAAVDVETSAVPGPWSLNVTIELQNAAATPAVFVATAGIGNRTTGSLVATEERHTRLLAPGETQTVWVEFPPLAWPASVDGVRVDVTDPYGNPAVGPDGQRVGPTWHAQKPPTTNPLPYGYLLHAADVYVVAGRTVTFVGDQYTAEGGKTNPARGQFVLVGPNGNEWVNTTTAETLPHQRGQSYTYACPNCTLPGLYVGTLWDEGFTRRHVDVVHVSPTRLFTEKENMDPLAIKEISLLSQLTTGFHPTLHDATTNPNGDVFADDSNGPPDLVGLLPRYTTLVIGSDVSQTALTPDNVKRAIATWVREGGNLVVLGTYRQESRWLEPVYHAAIETANGGISAPDPTHPILNTPNPLRHERYLDRARSWDIDLDAPFTHVLTRGSNGQSSDDTLAVSNPGAYDDGTVVLTSYMPGSITTPQDDTEAKRFLHNLLSQSHTMLFLDYGPPIPRGVPVGSDTRLVAVPHPNVPDAVVEVRLVMYVFG